MQNRAFRCRHKSASQKARFCAHWSSAYAEYIGLKKLWQVYLQKHKKQAILTLSQKDRIVGSGRGKEHIMKLGRALRRFFRFLQYGGFVQRKDRDYPDGGVSEYRAISGNKRYHVVRSLIGRARKPFRIRRNSPHVFSRL